KIEPKKVYCTITVLVAWDAILQGRPRSFSAVVGSPGCSGWAAVMAQRPPAHAVPAADTPDDQCRTAAARPDMRAGWLGLAAERRRAAVGPALRRGVQSLAPYCRAQRHR